MTSDLPYVDTHQTTVDAPRERVWSALLRYVDTSLGARKAVPLAWVLGTKPQSGFEPIHEIPQHQLTLAGRHRFAKYQLIFDLTDTPNGQTVLSAHTYSAFPGPHGRLYRLLVITTHFHALATTQLLHTIGSRATR
ncbi:hypothetical protein [Kribbella sp. VKM Ac-2568]|uniref:hypothetical protein n=1 Tax=Kribbella sp. VKM Ac-2568 TaxID=2512219 RepID=UPI001044D32C|nr:hypothetical protein [Kribbella sp. VKM Ac-2568]TCM45021.1 hypothetical protein EV648_107173 [Kribbella sp. VKM Ac-2568]